MTLLPQFTAAVMASETRFMKILLVCYEAFHWINCLLTDYADFLVLDQQFLKVKNYKGLDVSIFHHNCNNVGQHIIDELDMQIK